MLYKVSMHSESALWANEIHNFTHLTEHSLKFYKLFLEHSIELEKSMYNVFCCCNFYGIQSKELSPHFNIETISPLHVTIGRCISIMNDKMTCCTHI